MIRSRVPDMELEIFTHGALCCSLSGSCLFSSYLGGASGNRGKCKQPCRRRFFSKDGNGFFFSTADLAVLEMIPRFKAMNIASLKIEGRLKQPDYVYNAVKAYRHVLDDVAAGRPIDPVWRDEVEHVSHRPYATGFFYGEPGQYTDNGRYIRQWQIFAVVDHCDAEGNAVLSLWNKFRAGDTVEIVGPDCKPFSLVAPEMEDMEGNALLEPRTPQSLFKMKLPRPVPPMSFVRHAVDLSAQD